VSAWRNYYMANEWLELTSKRKISMFFHVTLTIVALEMIGLTNWASSAFRLHLDAANEPSVRKVADTKILRIATGTLVYCGVYLLQRLYNGLIHERFVDNPIQQFVDLSSLANCSVFILSMRVFGHYIHGRSPFGFSDTSNFEHMVHFRREEENLCVSRGLLPGYDQQTFVVLIPRNLRHFYDKLLAPQQHWQHRASSISVFGLQHHGENNNGKPAEHFMFEKTLLAHQSINRFLAAFVDHALKDLDYVIQDRNILEYLFDCEFQSQVTDTKGCFYSANNSFADCLFYGNESLLFQFELLLFLTTLVLSDSWLAAMVCVGLVYKVLEVLVVQASKSNLSKKTLIDKRFLV
jgi:meckelin